MRRGRIHGEKNMRNSRTKTQTKLRNYIKLTAGALLLAITFVLVFAGTLSGAFGIENELQQNGIIQSNVASAANTAGSNITIGLSDPTITSWNINPDVSKKGYVCDDGSYLIDDTSDLTWTTGNGSTGGRWMMGDSSNHHYQRYSTVWFDFDLGNDYSKFSDSISINVAGTLSATTNPAYVAITSSSSEFSDFDGNKGAEALYNEVVALPNKSAGVGNDGSDTSNVSLIENVSGRYVRIYFTCKGRHLLFGSRQYGIATFANVKVTLTRELKSYNVSYSKNGINSSTTVANTSHKYMAASNIASDFYVGNGQYFTGWNTNANGSGIAMAIGASTGTSTAANTFGNVVRSNLQNGQTTTTLYAQYQGISFTFNGKDYTQYNNEVLQVLQGRGGYLTHTVDSSYSTVVSYRNSNGSEIDQPITIGVYSAIIEVSKDGKTRGTVTLPFEIIEGDFGKIQGGTGKWGSVTNPYVISNETHLKNLSAIVNGRDALNSIVGSDGVTAEQVVATDKTYKDCYFVVAADLGTADAQIELVPIGKDSTHYFAGTIFGGNDSDANNRTMRTITLNIQSGDVSNVGLFGYVKGATISHLTTAGSIAGGAAVGGLVGYADGVTISNCRNNATVKALGSAATFGDTQGAYLGGFVGYATASVTIKNCYNGGEITTETSWPHSNIVGGIVGHLGTGGEVSYCYNKGKVVGSDNIGGIVGINNGTVSYCYQDGELNDLYLGTSPSNFITSNGGAIEHCWILPGASQTGFNQDTTPNGKQLELFDINGSKNNKMYAPVVVDGNTYYPVPTGNWKSIVEKDINGFEVFVADTNGNKSLLQKGEYLRSAKATPTIINSNATANKLGHTRQDSTTIDIVYVYSATVGNDVFVSHSRIGKTVSNTTYNGQNQDIGNIANLPTNTAASVFYFEKGNAASTATSAKKDWREGGYVVVVDIKIGDKVVGRDVFDWIINKKTLTVEYKWTQDLYNNGSVVYNGAQQGLTSFEIKGFVANESVESGNATVALTYTNTDYTLVGSKYTLNVDKSTNEGQYGVSFTLEANNYALDTNATHAFSWTISRKSITIGQSSFYYGTNIEQKLTDGTVFQNLVSGHSVRVDTQKHNFYKQNIGNNQYTILQSDITVNDNSGQPVTGNYNITGGVIITVLAGDFWSNGTTDIANNPWGSPHNPYVIGTKEQLTRLSAIVGGTSAVNSIKNDTYVYVQAQSGDYSGAYFKLADNIPSVGNITPIGSNTHSFAGNFDGNNKTISGLNISVAGNNVGLFGYISGATIKNLTVNGSVKGSQYVGGVVGYALNSTIENVTNNASVSTHQSQSAFNVSYTIKQKDGTEGNSNEGWDKINDNNDSTKYCASNSKTSLSFIIDLGSPITAWGFAIFNGGDTNKYPDRRPNEIYIWGSNSNSNAAFPSDSVGKNNSGNTPSGKGLSDYWTSVYSQSGVIGTSVTTRYEIGFPSIQSYRYYWVYLKSYGQQIQFAEFDILHAGDSIGGVVGYASGTNIKNATNNENIVGGNYSGGIVGQISASSTQYTITDSKNIGSISGNDGTAGIVGGIASGGYVKISACENSGNISGGENSNGVAGIIGHTKSGGANRLVVDGCKNTGTISGGRNVGGIGGRIETTRNNKDSIVFTNCYNDKNITAAKYGTVGGIVGYLYANGTTTVDVATISYCFSSGIMSTNATASSNVGGIVGNPNANSSKTSTRIFNCYTTNTTQGISGTSNATVDATNYVITSGTTAPTINNGGSYLLYDSFSSKPVVINNGTFTPFDSWADITKNDFNGFKVVGSVAKNEFFCSDNGSDTNTKYVKPSKTEGFAGDNGDVTTWYSATIESNIRVRVQNIDIDNKSSIYDNAEHTFDFTLKPSQSANSANVYAVQFAYLGRNYGEFVPKDVDVYDTTITVKIGDQVVGVKTGVTYTIDKAALNVGWEWTDNLHANLYNRTGNGDKVQFVYNGKAQGLDSVSEHLRDVQLFDVTGNDLINTNAATYTRTYTLKDTRNYKLQNANNNNADLSGTTVTFEWKIRKNKLTVFNRWVAEDFGKDSNLYTFEYNTTHRGLLATNDAITFLTEKATDNTRPEFKQGTDYTISEHQNAINVGEYSRTVRIINTNYEVNNTTAYVGSSSNATVNKGISVNGLVVTYTWKIVPYSLATNIISGNVWFGGTTNLIVGNQAIANVEVGTISYADKRFYPLQSAQTGVQQVLVYAQHNYAADKFVLYVKYNNGTVAVLTQGTEYTLSALDAPTVENPTPLNTSVTASGTGNFSGNITKYYTAMFSDFGWKDGKTPEDNDWGGSAKNPYVISKPEHLLRLSQIVNGGTAWNSINTTDNALCIAPQNTAKATSRDYNDAYFLVTVNIDMSGYISTDGVYNFLPIGTRSTQNQTELPFSATFDGGDNTITYVYNVGSFYNVDGARKNYVGLFGYLNGATISNLKVASNGGLSITDNSGIVGIEYVGGIAGYAVDSTLYNSVLAYGGWVRGETYVGGIVGYGERITIVSSEAVSSANVGGETYVGGIVGKWIVSNQSQIGGSVAGQRYVTPADQIDVMGIKYVGGIAGWMDTSSCATTISYAPQLNNNGKDGNFIVVGGIEYVGALFGAFIGNGYHQNATNDKYTAIVIDKDASDNFKVGNVKVLLQKLNEQSASVNAKVVGGLVGYAEGVGILFNTDWTTSNVTLDTGNYTPSFIGGIAGVLGKNATIEAIYQLKDDGTFLTGGTHTITHSVPDEQKTFGTAAKPLGSFVGGIVGYVSSQAGVYWETGTTIFGNGISLVNLATIYATSYAGGIFGALGDLSTSVAQTFENDTNSILYNVLTTGVRSGNASTTLGLAPTVSGNGITAQGRLVNNASISVSGSYVGGIAGYGGAKVRFVLRNTPQDSAIDVSKLNIYSGGSDIFINGSYAGGIAGYLVDNLEHDLQYIVVKARFNTNNQSATRVGGLVGYMGSGNVQNCVVTNGGSSAITASTDTYQGSEYVGGLVGETQNATIRNSVSTGFNLEKTSNTKGGLLGYGANPTIDSSWTFYIAKKRTNFAKNATPNGAYYATVSQSPYGKYILVDEGLINATEASYPTFASLCGFVGLLTNANVEGTLEFAVKVPNKTLNSNYENTQLAFYNASGSDTVTDNVDSFSKFENNNNTLTIALDMASGNSMQICVVGIEFVNVPQKNDTDTDKTTVVEGKYRKPSNSDKYIVHVTTANFNSERQITKIVATVYFECNGNLPVVIGSAYDDKRNIGGYDETFTPGSSTNPYTISSQKEWNDFAFSIYSGANNYSGKYVKLLTDSIVINTGTGGQHAGTKGTHNFGTETTNSGEGAYATDNVGYNFAGSISNSNLGGQSFQGYFDGNGNSIEIEYVGGNYHNVSVFPNATGATFKNLTITGSITAGDKTTEWKKEWQNTFIGIGEYYAKMEYKAASDIAGFVGKPLGKIVFENCTNTADIVGYSKIAGFAGYSTSTAPVELTGCVNKGNIESFEGSTWTKVTGQDLGYPNDYPYGTGGLIAYAENAITIESCLNTGRIKGKTKVGGLVGRVVSATTINNSANTGYIEADEYNLFVDSDKKKPANAWSRVGGIVGEASQSSTLNMYACYNTGHIRGWSNVAGGLVGMVGTIPNKEKTHSAVADNLCTIAYSYNSGKVEIGNIANQGITMVGTSGYNLNGTCGGGLVGVAVKLRIAYSYNTGDIIGYGGVGYSGSWQIRLGGILAEACTKQANCDVRVTNCYSTGRIYIEENTETSDTRYGADIVGYLDEESTLNNGNTPKVNVADCYGVANNIVSYENKNRKYFSGWNNQSGGDVKYVRTGTTLNSLSDLTAVMQSNGTVKPKAYSGINEQTLWNASIATIGAQDSKDTTTKNAYNNGTLGGYVYVYGCLPQLAVFAVDTYNGLSMNSQNFGKDIYGEYKTQKAGEEYSPYVIRDGIDLMGVQTLVGLGYTFEGEYIEFANGSNNITLDKNLSSDVAKAINMPISNSTSTKIADSENAYKSLGKDNTYHIGKSYHLFKLSAVCYDDNVVAENTAYQYWLSSNHYYNGAYGNKEGAYKNYATFKTQNILTIGRNGNVFKGSISGKQVDNDNPDKPVNTVINNLRITSGQTIGGAYGGLFGHVENAYIGYIEVGGESNIWAYSSDNQQIAATGAIAGYVTGDSIIEHCAVSGTTAIGAYGKNDDTHIASDITYAGGIVGLTDPKQGSEYKAGISAIIKGCAVNISTTTGDRAAFAGIIQACKSNIGGVLGYVGGDAGASGKGNTVRIEGCSVDKAVIQAASSAKESSHIGGVLGYGSDYVAAFITGCKVGNGADTVTIKGEHSLGGIAGGMSNAKGGYIDSCIVGANTTIERINQGGGNISENPKHGTAIGGLVGFTEDSTDTTSPLTTTFSGTSAFNGKITVSVEATNPSSYSDGKISCIGGIVGDMGSGANFASGSNVTVGGNINITLAAANVGGVVGRTNKATFIGKFNVAPNMSTENAENVGGFIGKNIGTVYILADTTDKLENTTVGALNGTEITIGGKIKGTSEVGGFIGVNNSGSTLNIGSNVANAKPYKSGTLTIIITASVTGSGDNVGGIVGKNEGDDENTQDNDYATIDIVKGTIEQNGAIIGANNVGGIIGLNDGLLTTGGGEADTTIGGVTLSEEQQNKIKNLSINNTGSVTGTGDYVGGVVGKLDSPSALRTEDSGKGAIAGTFTNSGNVSGGKFVGGSLGYVGKNVTITAKNNVATLFVNDGQVTATGYYAGGSIGVLVGKIEGVDNGHTVNFKNTGTVTATGFVGGSIGVLAGPVKYAQFVNSSGNLSIAAVNAVGGSVGFIGVPTPLETILTGVGITLADDYVKVENTHFEASGELTANPDSNAISVAKDAATNKSTGWGGVGGAIGVIGKNVRWGTEQNKNTYYANGNVTANGINNVGGIVGIILAENVNISNMLAYNTTVKGGENVGGIVGATDGIGTVITSAYAIEGTFTGSKNVGGIIGLAKTDTDASTSYWVKGYANAILAGTDVKNLQQDLGKFETIIEYVGEQPIVFTEELCKMYTPKTYYDDYPGTHTYNGKTITLGENVEQLTWYDYFKDKLGETSAQIKNGAWVKPIANAPTYTTGANNTGWYFVYATDKTIGTINAEHSTNANLQYWKRIADAYTSSERNEGNDDNVKNPLASDIVLGNGAPQKSTLYATATAAGTESGYYLYMATSGKSRPSATNQGNKFYIQTLTTNADALAENVAVYYRTISKGKALTFNGYLRYAPVGITASEGETVSYIKNPETATGKPNSYCYSADTTTAGGQGTDGAQTNPGSFHSQVNIYYFDSEGKPHVVGGVAIGWTINKRDLTAEFTANTDRTYGEDRKQEGDGTVKHDMKLVVGNIAPEAGKNAGIVITISSDNESYTFTWDGTRFDKTSAGGIVISAEGMTDPGATNGWDASDSLYNVTEPDDKQTKDFSCFIDFTNAKTYTISVTTTATSGAQYTLDKTTNFSVKQATLTLKGVPTTNNPDSVIFDNKTHAFSWKVEGFKYNDDISQLALFSPTAYALGKSAPLFNSGTPNTMKTGSVTIEGVENVTYTIYSNSNSIDISGARDKGEYYIAFATLSAGNYKLKLDKGVESLKQSIKLSISDNELTFDWRDAGGSHPYDKKTKGTITLTITAKSAIDGFENFVKKFFAPTMSGTGANAVWGTASDNKSITITFTTGVNAGTYTATIAQNKNETAFIEANKVNCSYPMIPQSRSYEIDKRNLTITLISKDNKTSYTYNGQHQGLVSIRVNSESGSTGLISGDSVNATVSVSREGTEFGSISVSAITSSTANNVRLSTINFGKYIATVTMAENTNYTCQQSGTLEWEIKKYQLTLSDLTGGQKVYDGIATKPTLKVNGVSVDNGEFTPSGVSGDRIEIKYSASIDGQSYESIVNAGKYSVSIGGNGANAITVSPATRDGINTADNYSIEGGQSVDYVILPRTLKLSWQEIQSFVFSNTEQGLIVVGVEGVEDGGNGSLAVKSGTSTINGVKLTGYAGGDTIEITIIGALLHANSTSKMEAKITSVSGTNKDGSNSIEGNYTLSEDDRFSGEFTITPSVVSIKFNAPNATLTKVYDGNRTVPTSQINDSYFSWSATGHNPTRNPFKVTAQYDNKNVGDKKAVTFSYTFTDPTNVGDYVVGTVDGSAYTVGQITPAHIKVALNKLRGGKATRTYTDDEFYGGAEGATGNGRSKTYRTGEGFTVSGVLGSDNINVVARYQEADNTRNSNSGNYFDFSKYVNDVYKDADGTFKKASAGKYFKKLVFTMTGTDAANYTFNVYDSSAEGGNKYSESDSTAAAIQSVTVYDSRDSKNKNASGAASIQIEITVKSVRVEYSDTAQSYANDDNTYNTDWKPITGTNKDMDKADAKIKVSNGWMYADGKDHTAEEGYTKREYRGYTTIRGSQNSERLGAKVDPTNGMDLNYRLSNQPTLTIAYFVSTGDEYEINSLARLLIASFYYTASQNPGNLEIIKIVSSGYKWVSVVSADDYDKGEFELPQDTPITDSKATTWDEYFTELEAKGYSVFLNIEANAQDNIPANTWGYYATTTSESSTIPTSYKLTKDIVGKFTESDISILNTFFTVIGDDGQTITSTWSGNGTYLKNVLKAAEGKIATINGSLFVSTAKAEGATAITGFDGTFDGNGYVIEYLNIMGYGKDNVGLFDVIGANGIVKNLHLRNVTINGNAKYVGGIAGKVLAAADALTEKSVKNVSFHGSINVTGSTDQSVGGLFGASERAVENAIVLGSITVSNVNAKVGGVVGSSEQGMSNVVSLMQIDANCNVGAFSQTNRNVTNSYHLQNAVWRRNGSSITFVNHANAKTFDELMSGSVSGYGTTNKYYHESETSVTKGEYDVLNDVVLTKISVDNKENARQSMRLADIVKVYLLMYSLNETQATDSGNLNGANVYAISTSSWLVGTADGTSENAIFIANKQNVSLLRELRFASFTLKANVSIEIASTFSGAFYGSVNAGAYKITCDKAMFEAYANDASAWLSVQQ